MKQSNRAASQQISPFSLGIVRGIRRDLLKWYDTEKRDLPWRKTSDPYAILVSEFMLQQTQVQTAIPYYNAFVKRFPDLTTLANADEQDVLRLWAGLGYYSRARNLHAAAQRMVSEYKAQVPANVLELLFLPGVGTYVAGAVASIAFGEAVPAVDANVVRVISRLNAIKEQPDKPRIRREIEQLAAQLVDPNRPGDFNQAMMELGALICTASGPRCTECPLCEECTAARTGSPEKYPPSKPRKKTVSVHEAVGVIAADSADERRWLLVRDGASTGKYGKMWGFPSCIVEEDEDPQTQLLEYIAEEFDINPENLEDWAEIKHTVTHHRIRKEAFLGQVADNDVVQDTEDAQWLTLDQVADLPLGAPHKKLLALLQEREQFFHL